MKLSIIILSYNSGLVTGRCLDALQPLGEDGDVEIIVIDNGSTDGSGASLEKRGGIRFQQLSRNLGVAAGRNRGLYMARGEYVMFLDNDTIPTPEAVRALVKYMDTHLYVGLCGPRLVSADGKTQRSFRPYPGLLEKWRSWRGTLSDTVDDSEVPDSPVKPYYVIGACQIFRRMIRLALDENIFYGPEDADFCRRVRGYGYYVEYNPQISIVHDWNRAGRSIFSPLGRKHIRGLIYFWLKYKRLW